MLHESFTIERDKKFGRYIYSSRPTTKSRKTVLTERPIAFQVFKGFEKKFCHLCLQKIKINASIENDGFSSAPKFECRKCSTFYCSLSCQKKGSEIHQKTCKVLSHISGISGANGVSYDLLRLLTKICYLDLASLKSLSSLVSHKTSVSDDFRSNMIDALNDLMTLLSGSNTSILFSAEKLFTLVCKINANSHAIFDHTRTTNQPIGLGMFPLTAILNHSCTPNAVFFTNDKGEMQVDAIRPLEQGEQIFISYVDLFAPKYERRGKLLETKQFWCECKRCVDQISDCWIDAFKCDQCLIGFKIEKYNRYECTALNCSASSTSEEIMGVISSIQLDQAEEIIKAGMLDSGKCLLEKVLVKANDLLHPNHYIILNTLVNLVDVCSKLNHFVECLQYCDLAIDQYRRIMNDAQLVHSSELDDLTGKKEEIESIIKEAKIAGLLDDPNCMKNK